MASSEIYHNRLEAMSLRLDAVVPRNEHQLHWDRDAEKFRELNSKLDELRSDLADVSANMASKEGVQELKADVEAIKSNRLPPWFVLALISIVGPVLGIVVSHFIR